MGLICDCSTITKSMYPLVRFLRKLPIVIHDISCNTKSIVFTSFDTKLIVLDMLVCSTRGVASLLVYIFSSPVVFWQALRANQNANDE